MSPLDPVGLLVDREAVSSLVGRPVVTVRLRHKEGVSTVAALSTPEGMAWGWLQLVTPRAHDKACNAARRARERRWPVHVRRLAGGVVATYGLLVTDPRLHRAFDQLPCDLLQSLGTLAPSTGGAPVTVLRHNPLRRLVLRRGETVLRLTSEPRREAPRAARVLRDHGVPVARPLALPDDLEGGRRVTAWSWVPGTDLHHAPDPASASIAGRALAAWHATAPAPGLVLARTDPVAAVRSVAAGVRGLSAPLAERIEELLQLLAPTLGHPQGLVWAHGDFSADQVVVRPGGGVELVDLDRLSLAPAALDLGSFAAVELLRTRGEASGSSLLPALLEGYGDRSDAHSPAPEPPAPGELAAWTAYGLLVRAAEPLRRAQPTWRADMADRLCLAEGVLRGELSRA